MVSNLRVVGFLTWAVRLALRSALAALLVAAFPCSEKKLINNVKKRPTCYSDIFIRHRLNFKNKYFNMAATRHVFRFLSRNNIFVRRKPLDNRLNIVQLNCTNVLICREFRPYSRVPKKFLKKKDREKKNRDDVYFVTDQILPRHSLKDAIDTLRAYDLFGPEPMDILLDVNMGDGKDKIGVLKGLLHFPTPVTPVQKVLVFAEGDIATIAKEAGAHIVGGKELIKQVEDGELEFDHCLCTLDFLPNIKHLPKILRNKMPNTRRGTATDDILTALETFSHGETYMADNEGRIRQTVAKTNFSDEAIQKNLREFMTVIDSHKTVSADKYFKRASLLIPPGPKLDLHLQDILP
ncbi:50S ribosomal protein L1-like isoform X1 [Hydractinia symbiolongicarpus]|uniref:50S ribosomal protein L1-like isoform X1 n=1 Tax=Hydractinia symbiolongicarpus TaxID=13093 RepID=UPI00254ABE3E|nr:50S ribosomal protein L1-like isoform X1 [Hydractinia symbiolongicarpus]